MKIDAMNIVAASLFAMALIHTFAAKTLDRIADRNLRHAGLFHLLGEVEVVFGLWAVILIAAMALIAGGNAAIEYAESRQYTEPLFVFFIMVVAASRPVLGAVRSLIVGLAAWRRYAPLWRKSGSAWQWCRSWDR